MAEAGWQEPTELIIEQIEIGPMQNYTYIIGSRESREVAIVDPAWDIDALMKHLAEKDYTLKAALATHYHPDHIGGLMEEGAPLFLLHTSPFTGLFGPRARSQPVRAWKSNATAIRRDRGGTFSDLA